MSHPTNPILARLGEYPFARLVAEKRRREAAGQTMIDLGMGDPREVTPEFIRAAMVGGVPAISSYPTVKGEPPLRRAIAAWLERRFGVRLDPETEILPTQGSKEGIFHAAFPFLDPASQRRTVVICQPAYPVYAAGALYAGGVVHDLVLSERHGFQPDLDAVDPALWERTVMLWLNYPHNPTGHAGSLAIYERALALAERHGFLVAADECYVDLFFGAEPRSALEVGRKRLLAFHSLSKRSAMTGFRSGFIAGDAEAIAALTRFRPNIGCAMPEFVQAASVAAWSDDVHPGDMRALYRAKREVVLPAARAAGLVDAGGDTTFYLWLRVPPGVDDARLAEALLEHGLVVCPGSFLGAGGSGYIRLALVPPLAACKTAGQTLARVLPGLLATLQSPTSAS